MKPPSGVGNAMPFGPYRSRYDVQKLIKCTVCYTDGIINRTAEEKLMSVEKTRISEHKHTMESNADFRDEMKEKKRS